MSLLSMFIVYATCASATNRVSILYRCAYKLIARLRLSLISCSMFTARLLHITNARCMFVCPQIRQEKPYYIADPEVDSLVSIIYIFY